MFTCHTTFVPPEWYYVGGIRTARARRLRSVRQNSAVACFWDAARKVFIVVPLTYLMPYALHMGTKGVFLAEPVSNVIGGSICFVTMLCTVLPELKKMEK